MIRFENVVIGYHGKALMRPISFEIEKGDLFGLIGPNGAGKSTLLKTLLGAIPPIDGKVIFKNAVRPVMGYVPQRDSIGTILPLSVRQVVEMGKWARGRQVGASGEIGRSVDRSLEMLGVAGLSATPFRDLSGGQKQRVLFARALAAGPEVLIFDEPTNGMDLPSERATLDLITLLRRETGCTTLIVTHLVSSLAPYVNRTAFLDQKKNLFEVGSSEEMFTAEHLSRLYGRPVSVQKCGITFNVVVE